MNKIIIGKSTYLFFFFRIFFKRSNQFKEESKD